MKKLITTFIVAGAVLGLSAVTFGQAAGAKQGGAKQGGAKQGAKQGGARQGGVRAGGQGANRMGRMAKMQEELLAKLKLNADQKKKVEAHDKKMAAKMKAMFDEMQKKPNSDRSAMRAKFTALREEGDKGMKAILTADQWTKFEVARKEAREKMRKEFGGGAGGRPGARPGAAGGPGVAGSKRGGGA
jgi:hypothetical protein